jgi:hypothetical protein
MLTNWDLENEALKYNLPLIGVFNKDQIPTDLKNGFYIINLQDDYDSKGNDLPGSHWTVYLVEGKEAVYFDSFGFAPPVEVQNFLKPFVPYPYNRQMVQSVNSTVCGNYVLYFMLFMCHNRLRVKSVKRRFDMFLGLWSPDVSKNRDILLKYLKQMK